MPERYAALLRGISPMNCSMADLRKCLEGAGMTNVRTVLASGNAVFDTRVTSEDALVTRLERAFAKDLDDAFVTFVRSTAFLQKLLRVNPYADFELPASAKRVVTFLHEPPPKSLKLPDEKHGARMLCVRGRECFSAYLPGPHGPVFMSLIEKTFGKACTTRTWDTVRKVAAA